MHITNLVWFKSALSLSILGLSQLSFASSAAEHHHLAEHGGQTYQVTKFSNEWSVDKNGNGAFGSSLETLVGTDENRLFVEASLSKEESHDPSYNVAALYSRNVAEFWDIQVGAKHSAEKNNADSRRVDAMVGIMGLAPYFFETKAYLYAGKDNFWAASIELERDLLLTQKLITQPYIEADFVLRDQSNFAAKTGLSEFKGGIKTRYEITKRIRPFIDVAYQYEKGQKQTDVQKASSAEKSWVYGLGIELTF